MVCELYLKLKICEEKYYVYASIKIKGRARIIFKSFKKPQ